MTISTALDVSIALPSDEDEIMEMCRELAAENELQSMNEDRVREILHRAFERKGGLLGVIRNPQRIEAMICMIFAQMWYTDEWHLEELWNFCRAEYRASNNARALMGFAKQCSEELGIPLLIGVISNSRTEAKVLLYKKMFSEPKGAFFVFNSKWDKNLSSVGTGSGSALWSGLSRRNSRKAFSRKRPSRAAVQ